MLHNKLKLNDGTTEFLPIIPKYNKEWLTHVNPTLNIDGTTIMPSKLVRNLGVVFDLHMDMKAQISSVTSKMHYYMRSIGRVRNYPSQAAHAAAVKSLVISRMDYGCSLLAGLPVQYINPLQIAQNNAARLVSEVDVLTTLHQFWNPYTGYLCPAGLSTVCCH